MGLFRLILKTNIFRARTHAFERSTMRQTLTLAIFALLIAPLTDTQAAMVAPNDFNLVTSSDTGLCLPAIERLGASHDSDCATFPLIQALAAEKRPVVRRYLVDALGRLRSPDSVPALKIALRDPDIQVRQSAVVALEAVGSDDSDLLLQQQAGTEKNFAVKNSIVHVLGRSKNPKDETALHDWARDDDPEIQKIVNEELKKKPGHGKPKPKQNRDPVDQ